MNQPPNAPTLSTPWLLIVGLVLGGGLLVYMAWDSFGPGHGKNNVTGSAHVIEVTSATWKKEVLESQVPVLVDFTAEWCGPCQMFAPTIARLAEKYKGKVKVCKFDVGDNGFDKARGLADEYGFSAVPTIMVFQRGELRYQSKRGGNEVEIVRALEAVLQ